MIEALEKSQGFNLFKPYRLCYLEAESFEAAWGSGPVEALPGDSDIHAGLPDSISASLRDLAEGDREKEKRVLSEEQERH